MIRPPGLIVAAASSHSGKTTVTVGLLAAFRARGLLVSAAKCGPDYLDPRFLEAASGLPAINLDPWAMGDGLPDRLTRHAEGADFAIIEGVMGLYDGGPGGVGSTASLAAATGLPVVLVVGSQGLAQSAAAVAEGFARLAEGFQVAGAIVNQVASDRHAALIREGFARSTVSLLGLVRRDPAVALPSRHLGLVQAAEHADLQAKIAGARELVSAGCDLDGILSIARSSLPLAGRVASGERSETDDGWGSQPFSPGFPHPSARLGSRPPSPQRGRDGAAAHLPPQAGREKLAPLGQRIAVARDLAFAFSYPHLLQDWRDQGAELRVFSPLADEAPGEDCDAVFLPGGYPELHAGRLAAASRFHAGMRDAAARNALIYGECGGYMALGDTLLDADGVNHRMLSLLPLVTSFAQRKLHLGYRVLRPLGDLPWSTPLAGHEFHFASITSEGNADRLFEAEDATGICLGPIGLRRGKVMGSFAHVIDRRP